MVFAAIATGPRPRIDWKAERDRIDLAAVATSLLGEAPGRRGERGRKLWWCCPFHGDANPSLCVAPDETTWRCYGCGAFGDAANLLMRLEHLSFPEAVRRLVGGDVATTTYHRPPAPPPAPAGPSGLARADAEALVVEAEARLWSAEGTEARAYLTATRRLTEATIRAALLGWTPGVRLPTREGKTFISRGIVIPWFDGDRLALTKIRQPGGGGPKYAEAFRDRTGILMGSTVAPGLPLVVVEGEFDCLLLGQELRGLAAVATLGPASVRPEPGALGRFLALAPWYVATDADEAGDKAADAWPGHSRRVRPPAPFNDWTEAAQGGVNLRRWWADRLAGTADPSLFSWPELAARRWGPGRDDPEFGIIADLPDPERRRAALEALGTGPGDASISTGGPTP